jgi:hypothetical protein
MLKTPVPVQADETGEKIDVKITSGDKIQVKEEQKETVQTKPLNCWEFIKCGKERFCPAYPNRGRKCALVVGNLDGRTPRGPLACKKDCATCPFYKSEHFQGNK